MPAFLKSKAPTEVAERIDEIEKIADKTYEGMPILDFPKNVAVWGTLTEILRTIEVGLAVKGAHSQEFRSLMLQCGRAASVLVSWIWDYGQPSDPRAKLKWEGDLIPAVQSALWVASNYDGFRSAYPAWQDRKSVV